MIAAERPMMRAMAPDGTPAGLYVDRDPVEGISIAVSDGRRALVLPISVAEASELAAHLRRLVLLEAN